MVRRFLGFLLVAALLAAGGLVALWWRAPVVAEVAVRRGTVAEVVYATGVVEPVEWAKVIPLTRGRIVELCGCEGREVRAGDLIARLDDSEARAVAREIDARYALASQVLERQTELYRRGAGTREALDRATAEVAQSRASMAAQRERIENLTLGAPRDGVVLRLDGQVGEVAATTDVIAWVGRPRPLKIVAEVAEEDIAGVVEGQTALLRHDAFRDRRLTARVDRVTPKGDPTQKTFRVHLALPEDTPLRIGMSVEANIVLAERADALVVPAEAVCGSAVFLARGGVARAAAITTGLRGPRGVEVTAGLAEGQAIVSPAPTGLADGDAIRRPGDWPWTAWLARGAP